MPANKTTQWFALIALISLIAGCLYVLHTTGPDTVASLRYGLRVAVVGMSLACWFLTQSLIASRGDTSNGITDTLHNLSAPLNHYLQQRPKLANGILIVSSLFIDPFALFIIGVSIFGPSLKPFFALLLLFILRQVCQAVCALPVPKDMIWRHPGFPSLLVTYGTSNDFFFSGHTAIAVLGAIEIAQIFPWWVALAAGVVALLEATVVIVLRAHYTMDIFAAVVAAFCVFNLTNWIWSFL